MQEIGVFGAQKKYQSQGGAFRNNQQKSKGAQAILTFGDF